jgi:nucleotide-binding universal stress UspA family protein
LGLTLFWMLRLPQPLPQEVAKAIYSVEATRVIVVPILDLFYSERAVELACRLGRQQHPTLVLAYIVEVPRLLTLDAPLPPEVDERAQKALEHAQRIVERHGLKAITDIVRAREADEGIRRAIRNYQADLVVLGNLLKTVCRVFSPPLLMPCCAAPFVRSSLTPCPPKTLGHRSLV